jgi:hypothetical protein
MYVFGKEEDQNAEEAAHEPALSNNMVGASGFIPITASTCAFLHRPMAPFLTQFNARGTVDDRSY